MDERQKKLVKDYGPRFYRRAHEIENLFLYLAPDGISVMTEEEWKECAEAIDKVVEELHKAQKIVGNRMKEAGVSVI